MGLIEIGILAAHILVGVVYTWVALMTSGSFVMWALFTSALGLYWRNYQYDHRSWPVALFFLGLVVAALWILRLYRQRHVRWG